MWVVVILAKKVVGGKRKGEKGEAKGEEGLCRHLYTHVPLENLKAKLLFQF